MTPRPGAAGVAYVALLRGINVGGKNMVAMKSLKDNFERLGFKDVSTYINSGNVLFRAAATDARKLEAKIDGMLAREYGLKGATVVRSHRDMSRLQKTISANWYRKAPDWRYNVMFLRNAIDSEDVLDAIVVKPDIEHVVYCPGALLWAARASDVTRSAFAKLPGQPIYQQMTIRNINTTSKICELLNRMHQTKRES
jgi:uncharacterized protein (DUF1697 family)